MKAAVTMGAELHMITTAEGVETEAQLEALQKLKCDQIQGNLILPAVSGERILELFSDSSALRVYPTAKPHLK